MGPERWEQIEHVCYEALMRAPAEQEAFLDEKCGQDADLRRQVESLLAADARAGRFLSSPLAGKPGGGSKELTDAMPRRLGNYELLRKIGEGGMSTVYLARRIDRQFRKRVAVKLLRRALAASTEYLSRFRTERQILASLEHPAIARLLDAGSTEDGSPYVVMELVEGVPIDRYCDRAGLSVRERLVLFREVLAAVQQAHQNLVVHRDLKPSNILVTRQGEPKLLDFGIAKLLDPDPTEPQLEPTATGQRLMTPQYASPEQIRGETITTASDVYSLGVVLHQLLSGHLPYRLEDATPQAMADQIVARSASRSSLATPRRYASERDPAEISRARGVRPEQLRRQLRGDLDRIVSKALACEPKHRYASVEQLDEDLHRHLMGLPVLAREPTWTYRWGKLVRRHRFKVAGAATFGLVLALFVGALVLQVDRTSRERARAEATLGFLRDVLLVADPSEAEGQGAQTTLGEALNRAVRSLDGLNAQPEIQAGLQQILGTVYSNLGLYDESESLLRQALAQRRVLGAPAEIVETLNLLALVLVHRGRDDEAEKLFLEALEMGRRELRREPSARADSLEGLGFVASQREELRAAERRFREALRIRRRHLESDHLKVAASLDALGTILEAQADYDEAEALLRQASTLYRERLGEDHPHYAISLGHVGALLQQKGDYEAAEPVLRDALRLKKARLGEDHPTTLNTLNTLAVLLSQQGQAEAAIEIQREVLAGYLSRFDESHPTVARSYHNLAAALRKAGSYEEAESYSREAIRLARSGMEEGHPNLAFLLTELAQNLLEQGEAGSAEPLLREALSLRRQGLPAGHWLTADSRSLLGLCLARRGRFEPARPLLVEGWQGVRSVRGAEDRQTRIAYERLEALPEDFRPW